MSSSNEISIIKPDVTEEIYSVLKFPGVKFEFAISKEETWDGPWLYRIYHPINQVTRKHKLIEELEFNRLESKMKLAAEAFNGSDPDYAKRLCDELVKDWEKHWGNEIKK